MHSHLLWSVRTHRRSHQDTWAHSNTCCFGSHTFFEEPMQQGCQKTDCTSLSAARICERV